MTTTIDLALGAELDYRREHLHADWSRHPSGRHGLRRLVHRVTGRAVAA